MAEQLKTEPLLDQFPFQFRFFQKENGRMRASSFVCPWWHDDIRRWDEETVEARRHFVQVNGTPEHVEAFKLRSLNAFDELRNAIAGGWNKLHPKLPGKWNYTGSLFRIEYTE
jgi:hypothetical protein